MMRHIYIFTIIGIIAFGGVSQAQYIQDALRLSTPPDVVSARAASLGGAFIGVADDFSAIYYNPAGLGLMRRAEFSMGLMNANGETETSFLNTTEKNDEGNFSLNNIGLALPFPVDRGSLVFAFGYTKLIDYTGAKSYGGFNTQSSIIPTLYNGNEDFDLSWQLGLQDTTGFTTLVNNLEQHDEVISSGNLSQWSFGGSTEVAKDVLMGITVNVISGSFISERTFEESDPSQVYQDIIAGREFDRRDFQSVSINETIDQELSGWNVKFGALYNYQNKIRAGLTIQTPTTITVDEIFSRGGTSVFEDFIEEYRYELLPHVYDIQTPWVFGFGLSSAPLDFLRISADMDMRDYSEIEISNSNDDLYNTSDFNSESRRFFKSTVNYRFGLEFQVPRTGLIIRGGYGVNQSPYEESEFDEMPDGLNMDTQIISGGIGYIFRERFILNASYIMTTTDNFEFAYIDDAPVEFVQNTQKITNTRLMFSIAYMF